MWKMTIGFLCAKRISANTTTHQSPACEYSAAAHHFLYSRVSSCIFFSWRFQGIGHFCEYCLKISSVLTRLTISTLKRYRPTGTWAYNLFSFFTNIFAYVLLKSTFIITDNIPSWNRIEMSTVFRWENLKDRFRLENLKIGGELYEKYS